MVIYMIAKISLTKLDGATIHETNLYKNFRQKHKKILFFVEKANPDLIRDSSIIEVPHISLKFFSKLSFQFFLFLSLFRFYRKKHLRPQVMYLRYSPFQITPIIFSKIFKVPCVTVVNGISEMEMKLKPLSSFPLFLLMVKVIQIWMYKSANWVITVNSAIKEHIVKNYSIPSKKIIVIENGADITLFRSMNLAESRKKIGVPERELHHQFIGFVGRLTPWQGIEFLILSAPLIIKKRKKIRFLIVGGGEMKQQLVNLVKDLRLEEYFNFLGQIPYSQVPFYINACEIMVNPRRDLQIRSSPMKIYEYLACEKPVIVTRVPYHKFIEKQNFGILANPDDPKSLALQILNLLDMSKDAKEKMGKKGRAYVCKDHSWKSVALKTLKILKSLIKN